MEDIKVKNKNKKKIVIVGAGPGGLTAGMLLSHAGHDVTIYEQKPYVGGRNGHITLSDFRFDIGPTFLLMRSVLDEVFSKLGRNLEDYLKLFKLDPMYRLAYGAHAEFFPSPDKEKMKAEMERLWPGSFAGYEKYLREEQKKYAKLYPCLKVPYSSLRDCLTWQFISSLRCLDAHKSLYKQLGKYFTNQDMITSFAFQAKYIGMSPWKAPGTFSIISYIEHGEGIYHVEGGLHKISEAMAKITAEEGGTLKLNTPVKQLLLDGRRVTGVELMSGEQVSADRVVLNADFAHAMTNLVDDSVLKKWNKKNIDKKLFSCSTFMMYLGVDKLYDNIPHHNIVFSEDYKQNVKEISETYTLSADPSFYIQNASITDSTLAPAGKSALYVLVPIANAQASIDWETEKEPFKEKIYQLLETRGKLKDLRAHVVEEKVITPLEWQSDYSVYNGATFNLGHNISQMLLFRPHNRFEEFKNCYLVGGGTHPGSGLPTIYESGRISADMINCE